MLDMLFELPDGRTWPHRMDLSGGGDVRTAIVISARIAPADPVHVAISREDFDQLCEEGVEYLQWVNVERPDGTGFDGVYLRYDLDQRVIVYPASEAP